MLATYKVRAWLLAGLVSLPAMAEQAVSASPASALTTHWEFAGTTYEVAGSSSDFTVTVNRQTPLSANQMKALCRKGLGLPLRAEYEDKLIAKGLIASRFSTWPMTNLRYDLSDIHYSNVGSQSASCSATLTDSGKATNLDATALSYAVAYFATQQYDAMKPMLPYLMKQPAVAMDAAGLVTLLLSQQDNAKATAYYQQYVDISAIKTDDIILRLAEWQYGQDLVTSLGIAKYCQSPACEQFILQVEDDIAQQDEASAGDLSAYF
ncbi:hypothetical protein ACFFLZ_04635 [Photobacterium aphoticum]|uniref:Lipoprotein n=1 Tax=Photobacterium aphoticum TaxID=754436 RepID=A0A090QL30_9GAMM|nr:hypothetical protein [Photobacterium aphoticum]KLV01715.1 hypothetical protein ABT58_04545 [Photobacterium aphoticum]PSU59294.1 hypothetical protein C9I90_04300 [Photobacterium aphoticum]GAL02494.1 hypothetical protein JCM19237_5387 [Photobacterium aphoticum]GHA31730.1 hypothetical protein GCM10007086_01070 [Photobacterium aphoticum]